MSTLEKKSTVKEVTIQWEQKDGSTVVLCD